MAYMNQEKKKALAPAITSILKNNGLTGSLSVDNHSTLVLTIREGVIDFCGNAIEAALNNHRELPHGRTDYIDVNTYHVDKQFSGHASEVLQELVDAMKVGNHDNSMPMIDYFDVGWYITIHIGRWNKPYELIY